jgi:hypothetical protein
LGGDQEERGCDVVLQTVQTKLSLSTHLFNTVLKFLVIPVKQEKEIKVFQIRKEDVKLSLFVDDMILYLKDPKNSTKNSQSC